MTIENIEDFFMILGLSAIILMVGHVMLMSFLPRIKTVQDPTAPRGGEFHLASNWGRREGRKDGPFYTSSFGDENHQLGNKTITIHNDGEVTVCSSCCFVRVGVA